eukprot:CAMPEP_0172647748 /NCGR_PEP_ID=MMETSP1068-20121228/240912_1 /TAXON_ID=35684 /ORGANISM="Pseudopedinella elastica, Strain CCMP716" /LENGTH=66 /DNA_ID=CAMNT_0013462037 /DNA_START=677 /DNA_END=877 /DNA_ORIENTATION=-
MALRISAALSREDPPASPLTAAASGVAARRTSGRSPLPAVSRVGVPALTRPPAASSSAAAAGAHAR